MPQIVSQAAPQVLPPPIPPRLPPPLPPPTPSVLTKAVTLSAVRLAARVERVERANLACSVIIAMLISGIVFAFMQSWPSHPSRPAVTSCSTPMASSSQCRPSRPRSAERIVSA
jgi:hypothetical protein